MLNVVTISGRLTADPEQRRTGNGIAVTSFTLACERDYKDGNGQRETDFIPVVAWRQTAEFVSNYFAKGQQAMVTGRLQVRKWQDKDGNNRSTAEIVADHVYFCGSKETGKPVNVSVGEDYALLDDPDEDIPF